MHPDASRRRFLATTAGGIAAAGLGARGAHAAEPTVTSGPTLNNPKPGDPVSQTAKVRGGGGGGARVPGEEPTKIGLAILGIGHYAAGQILPNLHAANRVRLSGFVSGDKAKREAFGRAYGVPAKGLYGYDDFDRIIDNDEIEAVYVITPPALHEEFTIRAAQAGKHVICEKPMATTSAACRRMIQACKEADRKLMIGYRCHYETYNRRLMELGKQNPYGQKQFVTFETMAKLGEGDQWRLHKDLAGGGSMFDIGIYALNGARYATGEEPTHVSAVTYTDPKQERFREIEQSCAFRLQFPSGIIANCLSSYAAGVNRGRVICESGWYELEPATSYSGQRLFRTGEGNAMIEERPRQNNMFAAQLDHLAEAILESKDLKTPGEEGLRDVALIEKIYQAAEEGRTIEVGSALKGL